MPFHTDYCERMTNTQAQLWRHLPHNNGSVVSVSSLTPSILCGIKLFHWYRELCPCKVGRDGPPHSDAWWQFLSHKIRCLFDIL